MSTRRRSTTAHRPRVAGLIPAGRRAAAEREGAVETLEPIGAAERTEAAPTRTGAAPTRTEETTPTRTATTPSRTARLATVPVLAAAATALLLLAGVLAFLDHSVRSTPSASNTALVDVAATAEAAGQLSDALESVYSYDFARLAENERAAREVITPEFAAQFDTLWQEVENLAPQQQAVVTATVTHAAVQSIEDDRAVVVVFMDQQATRTAPGAEAEQISSAGRLTVTGEQVDGRWKIADVAVR